MKTIFKYELEITANQKIDIDGYIKILKVAEQNGKLFMWYMVDPNLRPISTIEINIKGTGHELPDDTHHLLGNYFDTVLMSKGLVWHVFLN